MTREEFKKLQVGDIVKIKSFKELCEIGDEEDGNIYLEDDDINFAAAMQEFCGYEYEIDEIFDHGVSLINLYNEGGDAPWYFSKSMIECRIKETLPNNAWEELILNGRHK